MIRSVSTTSRWPCRSPEEGCVPCGDRAAPLRCAPGHRCISVNSPESCRHRRPARGSPISGSARTVQTCGCRRCSMVWTSSGVSRSRTMQRCSTMVDLTIEPLNFGEFGRVLPSTSFLNGTVRGRLQAAGRSVPCRSLSLNCLSVRARSASRWRGEATCTSPKTSSLDVRMRESIIDPADPLALMPSFELPDLRSIGPAQLNILFRGTPLVIPDPDVAGDRGRVDRNGRPCPHHRRSAVAPVPWHDRGPDAGSRTGARQAGHWRRGLNGKIEVDGAGVDLHRIYGTLHAVLDTSTFRGLADPEC